MITIIVQFTKTELQAIEELESRYEKLFDELRQKIHELRPEPEPNTDILFNGLDPDTMPDEWHDAIKQEGEIFSEWEKAGSKAWKDARANWWKLSDQQAEERSRLFQEAEKRQFAELKGDTKAIIADFKKQVVELILSIYKGYKDKENDYSAFSAIDVVALGGREWKLDAAETRKNLKRALHLHFDALKYNAELTDELDAFIISALSESPYVAKEGTPGRGEQVELLPKSQRKTFDITAAVTTKYPNSYLTPVDKVSNLAFTGELHALKQQAIAMERRGSKKQINTLASIDFEKLTGSIEIKGRKELTPYDRVVHDAIVTLYVDGGNEYITPQMIYQVMTGNPKNRLEAKQAQAISDSITKCLYSRLIIDASAEAKAYGFESFKYDGSLISGERVTATLNGTVIECLHILRKPVLYEYADRKNQIGRFDIKLLNSPIRKTEEIIALQDYLSRRILSMKGGSQSKTIVYDTVYNQISVTAASPGALRVKKANIRKQVKTILDYWQTEGFIVGYVENTRKTEVYSVSIRLKATD